MWGLLNETLNRNIRKQSTHEFSLNNKTTSDPEVIANECNQYFANIGSNLLKKYQQLRVLMLISTTPLRLSSI